MSTVVCMRNLRNLKIAHYSCAISRSRNCNAQSRDWNAISGFRECATQSRVCANSQIARNMYICMCKSGVCSHYTMSGFLIHAWFLSLINRLLNVCALPHKSTFHFRSGYSNSYCMYYQTHLLKTTIIIRNDTEK